MSSDNKTDVPTLTATFQFAEEGAPKPICLTALSGNVSALTRLKITSNPLSHLTHVRSVKFLQTLGEFPPGSTYELRTNPNRFFVRLMDPSSRIDNTFFDKMTIRYGKNLSDQPKVLLHPWASSSSCMIGSAITTNFDHSVFPEELNLQFVQRTGDVLKPFALSSPKISTHSGQSQKFSDVNSRNVADTEKLATQLASFNMDDWVEIADNADTFRKRLYECHELFYERQGEKAEDGEWTHLGMVIYDKRPPNNCFYLYPSQSTDPDSEDFDMVDMPM